MTQIFDPLNGLNQYRIDRIKVFPQVIVRYLKQFTLGIIKQVKDIGAVLVSITDDLSADTYQFTLNKFLKNDPRMCLNIG